jgi:hypothetical protein
MKGRIDFDDHGREVIVHSESAASVNAVMEECKARQSCGITGERDMRHLAEYPGWLIQKYCDTAGIQWNEWFQNPVHARRMMADPALAYFRVDTLKVSTRGE